MKRHVISVFKVHAWIVYLGLLTAGVVILSQVISLLVLYRHLKLDYYLCLVAIGGLVAGGRFKKNSLRPGTDLSSAKHTEKEEIIIPLAPEISRNLLTRLTSKEMIVLRLLVGSKSNKEIAAELFIEVSTVKTHINNIYSKLSVINRKELRTRYAEIVQSISFS